MSVVSDSVRPHRQQPTRLRRPWDSPGKNTGVGCHFLLQCMKVKSESEVAQSCPTLRDPMDCSLPGSSVHGIFQARVLEWVASAFSEIAHNTQITLNVLLWHEAAVKLPTSPYNLFGDSTQNKAFTHFSSDQYSLSTHYGSGISNSVLSKEKKAGFVLMEWVL